MPSTTASHLRLRTVLAGGAAVLTLAVTGCSASGSSTTPQTAPSAGAGQGQGAPGGQRQPGVSGLIAARSGSTLQVQGTAEQTAVSWTSATRFTQLASTTSAALKTGLCAAVRPAQGTDASPGTTVAAASVTLSAAVDGRCTGGFGGTRPSGAPSGAPSGMPSAVPSGGPSGGPGQGGFRGADGKVTSVDGTTFVVAAAEPGGASTTDVTVTTSTSTTWSELAAASAAAAKVGRCAFATGSTSGTGSLKATTIRVSTPAADGTCAAGFGRGRGQAGQPGSGSTPNG